MNFENKEIKVIKRLAKFVISRQEKGKHVPGHEPLSGVFADCSMDCDPDCLSLQASRLLKMIRRIEKNQELINKDD